MSEFERNLLLDKPEASNTDKIVSESSDAVTTSDWTLTYRHQFVTLPSDQRYAPTTVSSGPR